MRAIELLLSLNTFLTLSILESTFVVCIQRDHQDLQGYLTSRCSKDSLSACPNNATDSQIVRYFADDKELKSFLIGAAMITNHLNRLMVELSKTDVTYNLRFPSLYNKYTLHNSIIQVSTDTQQILQSTLEVVNRILASKSQVFDDIDTIKILLMLPLGNESFPFVLQSLENLKQTFHSNADQIEIFISIREQLENKTRILTPLISNTSSQYDHIVNTTNRRIYERSIQGPHPSLYHCQVEEETARYTFNQARDNYQSVLSRAVKVGILYADDPETVLALNQFLNAEKKHVEALSRLNEMHRTIPILTHLTNDFDKIYAKWAQENSNLLVKAVNGLGNMSGGWSNLFQFLQPLTAQITIIYELIKTFLTMVSNTYNGSLRDLIDWKQTNILSVEMLDNLKQEMLFTYFLSDIYFDVLVELAMCQIASNGHLLLLATEEARQAYLRRLDAEAILIAKRVSEIFDNYYEKYES